MLRRALLSILFLVDAVPAQDIDTVVSAGSKGFTVLDQVESPAERADFLKILKTMEARPRLALADAFLANHPRSWLIADIYEITCKASIDLGDFRRALADGRTSSRIFPENALLLVPLANLEVQEGLLDAAKRDASDALFYLAAFAGSSAISPLDWRDLKQKLQQSSHFVLGRVAVTQGLRSKNPLRARLLAVSESELGLAGPAENPEAAYLLGIVKLARGQPAEAAPQFAVASRRDQPVIRAKALDQLRGLYQAQPEPKATFESWASAIPPPATLVLPIAPVSSKAGGEYAGSAACQPCHSAVYDSWQQTGMARMFRAYAPDRLIADFQAGAVIHDDSGHSSVRLGWDRRPYFEFSNFDGLPKRYSVDYIIGSKWQQAYATQLKDGRIQVFPIQYSALAKTWLNYWKQIDPPGSERADIGRFNNLSAATNYQSNCAICHTSQLRASGDLGPQFERATFREPGVDCEMCHGPSSGHVAVMKEGRAGGADAADSPVHFAKVDHVTGTKICAQCHRQSALRDAGSHGEMNYSPEGKFFTDFPSRPYNEFSRKAFYKDGRFRETTFISEAFTRSKCFRNGQAQCASCHNPHPADASHNPVSLKFQGDPDRMCLQCHSEVQNRIEAHTHHALASAGSRCVSCHMPKIMNSLLFKAASHQIDDIPRPEMTERFGQTESPLACLVCHSDRSVQWAGERLQRW